MVAKMSFPKRLLDALNYNEKKVVKGVAQCIGAGGYLWEAGDMNFHQKLQGLEMRNALNDRASTKTLHVSLNFDPSETLSDEKLLSIASGYLERIGFGGQPYLVYRHDDAGHPHLHIVSTTIREDGRRINTHNLGRNASEKARKELEAMFGLVPAEGQKKALGSSLEQALAIAVTYGKAETKRSIARVVSKVFNHYAFCSLAEYNAALRSFNVLGDGGKEGGRIHRHQGLVYRLLDERGEKVGAPIKASTLPGKPTLYNLQARFAAGEKKKGPHKAALKEKIDQSLSAAPTGLEGLMKDLNKKGVFTLPRSNGEGRLYGITYVDHETRCVFNGSDLGKGYSAAGMEARLAVAIPEREAVEKRAEGQAVKEQQKVISVKEEPRLASLETLLGLLVASGPEPENVPAPLLSKKKRKKRRPPGI